MCIKNACDYIIQLLPRGERVEYNIYYNNYIYNIMHNIYI